MAWGRQVTVALERHRESLMTESVTQYSEINNYKSGLKEQGLQGKSQKSNCKKVSRNKCLLIEVLNKELFVE